MVAGKNRIFNREVMIRFLGRMLSEPIFEVSMWSPGGKCSRQRRQPVQRPCGRSLPGVFEERLSRYGWNCVRGEGVKETACGHHRKFGFYSK